jgi:hypothetical protein
MIGAKPARLHPTSQIPRIVIQNSQYLSRIETICLLWLSKTLANSALTTGQSYGMKSARGVNVDESDRYRLD